MRSNVTWRLPAKSSRRRLVFHVTCYDEAGVIGEGTHERFIIGNEKFLAKAEQKKNASKGE